MLQGGKPATACPRSLPWSSAPAAHQTRSVVRGVAGAVAGHGAAASVTDPLGPAADLVAGVCSSPSGWGKFVVPSVTGAVSAGVSQIVAAYLTLFASLVFLGLVVVPPLANQIDEAAPACPPASARTARERNVPQVRQQVQDLCEAGKRDRDAPTGSRPSRRIFSAVTVGAFSALTKLVHGPSAGVLSPARRTATREPAFTGSAAPMRRTGCVDFGTDIYRSASGYVAGNIGISVIAGVVACIALTVLGVGFAAPLAVIVGVFKACFRSSAPRSPRSSWRYRRSSPASPRTQSSGPSS